MNAPSCGARLGAAVLTVLLIGGCTVTTSSEPEDVTRQTLEGFREAELVEWDLTEPPSAQDLGVEEGRDSAIFDRDGDDLWTVRLTLPEDAVFTTDRAIAVNVSVPDVPGALLNRVGANAVVDDGEQLAEVLRADTEQLGLDPAAVQAVLQLVDEPASGPGTVTSRVLDGRRFGYLSSSVEVRLPAQGDQIALNYTFSWEPGA